MGLFDDPNDNYIDTQFIIQDKDDSNDENEKETIIFEEIENEEKPLIVAQIYDDKVISDDEKIDNNILNDDDQKDSKKPTMKIADKAKIQTVNCDNIYSDFTGFDSLKRVLRRIQEMNENEKLKFINIGECKIDNQNELFKTTVTDFPVNELIVQSENLIANLIGRATDIKCPFNEITCNILIDCSSFISNFNKLYNFMIVISFSYALSALEIQFSIAIVADRQFRFVLKPYEEEISACALQRILDCLFIKRYKTNTADTFHHALEYMKYGDKKRTQRALFLFSDGLDENLVLSKSWRDVLLTDPNNSFGMIFIKPKFQQQYKKYTRVIENMWNSFNDVVVTAPSTTRLVYIDTNFSFETVITIFCTILSRIQKDINQDYMKKVDIKPEFIPKYDDLTIEMFKNINYQLRYAFDDQCSSIFRKINQKITTLGTRFPKLEVKYYRNKTEKMTQSLPCQPIKEPFDQLTHEIIYSTRNVFRPLLETIFKPNKASQTVLSSTGTDFDITALILNLINPVPDPLIYLEEKGGLIRNYGISIIIDSSKSCFNPLSSHHSYQTIKILFAALASIDVTCVDVIVATDSAPIVLASEISSLKLFSERSSLWPSLFNCLSRNSFNYCSMESAIHAAYDLRRMRSVDSTSYMFVLTDGLFQQEQKEIIQSHIMSCTQSGITTFGIGIGIYPNGIVDLFPQAIFASNPNDLIRGIASCFGDDYNDSYDTEVKHLAPEKYSQKEITDTITKLIQDEDNQKEIPVYLNRLKRLFAIDVSGSTNNAQLYHNELRKIFESLYIDNDAIMIWNSSAKMSSFAEIKDVYTRMIGRGGTSIHEIANLLARNPNIPRDHLILVTDGQVSPNFVQKCDEILQTNKIEFKYVTSYIIGIRGDLSVGSPFCRNCGSIVIEIKESSRKEYIGANQEDFSALDSIDSISNVSMFRKKYVELFNATKQKMIGTKGDPELKVKYEKLLERLKKSGKLDPETNKRIKMLIGFASGTIENVFDNEKFTAALKNPDQLIK